jgi:hypothetical protein
MSLPSRYAGGITVSSNRRGDEALWWEKIGIDPFPAARGLWLQTRPLKSEKPAEAPAGLDR